MSNISGKLNLLQLEAAVKKMKAESGEVECLIIPIEKNKLYKGEKGIYLDFIGFELRDKKTDSKDTHLVKQSFDKETREAMTEDEKKSKPIIGNLQVWGEYTEQEPTSSGSAIEEEDDLPF